MIQTITLTCKTGPVEQKALIVGDLAVHACAYWGGIAMGYTVTHILSGMQINTFVTPKWAIRCAKHLNQMFRWNPYSAVSQHIDEITLLIEFFNEAEVRENPHLE